MAPSCDTDTKGQGKADGKILAFPVKISMGMSHDSDVEQQHRLVFYHRLLVTAGLLYIAWGILLTFIRPGMPNYLPERLFFGGLFLLIYLLRQFLGSHLIAISHVATTLCVMDFAFMTARSGAANNYLFGMIVMAVGFFFAFIDDAKAYLLHVISVVLSFVAFTYAYDVLTESSVYIRQICLVYFVMYWIARVFDKHAKTISRLRRERTQLLEKQKAMVIENLRSIQSFFVALSSNKSELPEDIDIRVFYRPADEAGGDWVSYYYSKDKNWLILIIGDVTGHDLSSSLVTVSAAAAARCAYNGRIEHERDLQAFVHYMAASTDTAVNYSGVHNKGMTAVFVGLDLNKGEGVSVSCGHPPIILGDSKGARFLTTGPSTPLGSEEFAPSSKKFSLDDLSSLLIFSDGLTDNSKKRISGRRLLQAMGPGKNSYELLAKDVEAFSSEDDVTFLTLELKQKKKLKLAGTGS